MAFPEEVQWATRKSRSVRDSDKVHSMAFTETVYAVWLQRNAKAFNNKLDKCDTVAHKILFNVACRSTDKMKKCFI